MELQLPKARQGTPSSAELTTHASHSESSVGAILSWPRLGSRKEAEPAPGSSSSLGGICLHVAVVGLGCRDGHPIKHCASLLAAADLNDSSAELNSE